jgi:endonuclease III
VIRTLREFYGLQPTPPADLFQFLVWEVLSENALPARRDLAWQALRRIPALTPDAFFRAPAREVLDAVGIAGPHRDDKVDRIKAIVGEFKRHRDLLRVETLSQLRPIGVGRALRRLEHVSPDVRARAVLFAIGRAVLPIDEDVTRVISRLRGDTTNRRRQLARQWLASRLAADTTTYRDAVIYLRHHAHQTCVKVGPHCNVCPLRIDCRSVQRGDATP